MKIGSVSLLVLLLTVSLLAFSPSPAHASTATVVQVNLGSAGATFTNPVTSGNLLVITLEWVSTGGCQTPSISDTLNTQINLVANISSENDGTGHYFCAWISSGVFPSSGSDHVTSSVTSKAGGGPITQIFEVRGVNPVVIGTAIGTTKSTSTYVTFAGGSFFAISAALVSSENALPGTGFTGIYPGGSNAEYSTTISSPTNFPWNMCGCANAVVGAVFGSTYVTYEYTGYYPWYSGAPFNFPYVDYYYGGQLTTLSLENTPQTVPVDANSAWSTLSPAFLDNNYWTATPSYGLIGNANQTVIINYAQGANYCNAPDLYGLLIQACIISTTLQSFGSSIGTQWVLVLIDSIIFTVVFLRSDSMLLALIIFILGMTLIIGLFPAQLFTLVGTAFIVGIVGALYRAFVPHSNT